MRLFLDAHVSGRRIATALRKRHDVRAADEERELDGWEDERLLTLASEQGRIMVTFNVKDFARITTEWAAAGKSHAGCLLIVRIDHAELGLIVRVIDHAFETRGRPSRLGRLHAWGPISHDLRGSGPRHGLSFGRGRGTGGRKREGVNQPANASELREIRTGDHRLPCAPWTECGRNKDATNVNSRTNKWL